MSVNPYQPPESALPPPPPAKPPVVINVPIWAWRALFVLAAVVLLADAFTRNRPEWRPVGFSYMSGLVQIVVALFLLLISRSPMQPTSQANQISN
jgi:hypothetical protein